jgi:hypothetical protein
MKLKMIAAAAMAIAALPSYAAIEGGGDGELFLAVQAPNAQISFTLDLGQRFAQFVLDGQSAAGASFSWDLNDAQFASFLASTTADLANYRWAVLAIDAAGSPSVPNAQGLLATATAGTTDALIQSTLNANLRSGISTPFQAYLNGVNITGTHGAPGTAPDYTVNGSSTNAITDPNFSYFGEAGGTGPRLQANALPFNTTNLVGTASSFYRLGSVSTAGTIGTTGFDLFNNDAGAGSFLLSQNAGAYTLTYTIAAVPEPTGLALLLAGLGAVGFVGRRRQPR